MTWRRILPHWPLLVADLREVYGITVRDELDRMPWPDFRDYVFGLFGNATSRLRMALRPPKPAQRPPV